MVIKYTFQVDIGGIKYFSYINTKTWWQAYNMNSVSRLILSMDNANEFLNTIHISLSCLALYVQERRV